MVSALDFHPFLRVRRDDSAAGDDADVGGSVTPSEDASNDGLELSGDDGDTVTSQAAAADDESIFSKNLNAMKDKVGDLPRK